MSRAIVGLVLCVCCVAASARVGSAQEGTPPFDKAAGADSIVLSELIYDEAPYPQCHASTIAEIAPGVLGAAWFGGTAERNPDVCIWFARKVDGMWETPNRVADGVQGDGTPLPTWNPVLFQAPNGGALFLFYKVGPSPALWWGKYKKSADGGRTWTEALRLPEDVLGPIKNKPIVLADGSWLSGSSREGEGGWRVHFERSTDEGATWTSTNDVVSLGEPPIGAIQPSVLTFADGRLEAVCRSKNGFVAATWSKDGGATWSPMEKLDLPNPNSGTDAVTLKDGRQLLVYNHSAPPPERPTKGTRYPLDIAVSNDGVSWKHVVTLESEPVGNGYAYPAVIQTSDGLVHTTYTLDRKRIKHVVVDPSKF